MTTPTYIEKHRSPRSALAGRTVPDHEPPGARVLFVTVNPSAVDVVRQAPLSGAVRKVFTEQYLAPAGLTWDKIAVKHLCPVHLTGDDGRPRGAEPSEFFGGQGGWDPEDIIVSLGKEAFDSGGCVGIKMPHPAALLRYGATGEVKRKAARLKKMLTEPAKRAQAPCDTPDQTVRVLKADQDRRQTLGIVLEPMTRDLQGDVLTPEEIEKAAHDYLLNPVVGEGHSKEAQGSRVVESYIAPVDFEAGGQTVHAGTWLMTMQHDDQTWQRIKQGEFTGYSIGGIGSRTPFS